MSNIRQLPQPPMEPPANAGPKDFVLVDDLSKLTGSSGYTIRKMVLTGKLAARRRPDGVIEIYKSSAKAYAEAAKARLTWLAKRVGVDEEVAEMSDRLSPVQVAKHFDIAEETVRRHHRAGLIKGVIFRGRLLFEKSVIKAYKGFDREFKQTG